MREAMITYIEKLNNKASLEGTSPVTRLYYTENNEKKFVEDFSYFANENYMSKSLLNTLAKGQNLTSKLQTELDQYVIEEVLK